jgi:two-component system chemotaxis response regulator CheV
VLSGAGYSNLESFDNGKDCYSRILAIKQQAEEEGMELSDQLSLLISDIEMPKMDGLTLCKMIKADATLKDVKVVLFSSLINAQMAAKCDSVGADGYAAKPQIPQLVKMMDRLLGLSPGADDQS